MFIAASFVLVATIAQVFGYVIGRYYLHREVKQLTEEFDRVNDRLHGDLYIERKKNKELSDEVLTLKITAANLAEKLQKPGPLFEVNPSNNLKLPVSGREVEVFFSKADFERMKNGDE